MAESRIKKVDSSVSIGNARAEAGPAHAGIEYDKKAGLVINPDNLNKMIIPDFRRFVSLVDDFTGDSIDTKWNSQGGTDDTDAAAISAAIGGVLRLTTGNDVAATMAANGIQFDSGLNWKAGQRNVFAEFRVKLDTITSVALFLGFTDQVSALEMPFTLGASDALTSNASDGVGFLFDTGADTDNWFAVGVANNVDATKQNLGVAPTAATYVTFRVELTAEGHANFFRNDVKIGSRMMNAVTPTVALTPVIAAFARNTTAKNIDVDYIAVGGTRP